MSGHRYIGSIWIGYDGPVTPMPPKRETCEHCGAKLVDESHSPLEDGQRCSNIRLHHRVAELEARLAAGTVAAEPPEVGHE